MLCVVEEMAVAPCGGLLSFVAGNSRSLTGQLSSASSRGLGLQTLGLHAGALAVRRGMAGHGWVWLGMAGYGWVVVLLLVSTPI